MTSKPATLGSQAFKRLRASFKTGKTLSLEWRTKQLNQLKKMIIDNREEWEKAVYTDLHQDLNLRNIEVNACIHEVDYMLKNVKSLMQPENEDVTSAAIFPASGILSINIITVNSSNLQRSLWCCIDYCTMELSNQLISSTIGWCSCSRKCSCDQTI
jgi:hypothetical protein